MTGLESLPEAGPAAVGAIAGGGGVFWLAKFLLSRTIKQYDKNHEEHAQKLEKLSDKLIESQMQVAVLTSMFNEAKNIRLEISEKLVRVQGELETKYAATYSEVNDLRLDMFVAHERLRLLASGDNEITKIKKPESINRR